MHITLIYSGVFNNLCCSSNCEPKYGTEMIMLILQSHIFRRMYVMRKSRTNSKRGRVVKKRKDVIIINVWKKRLGEARRGKNSASLL